MFNLTGGSGSLGVWGDPNLWESAQLIPFSLAVLVGQLLIDVVFEYGFRRSEHIPIKGQHLDKLEWKDWSFIIFNRVATCAFTYHLLLYSWNSSTVFWKLEELTFGNTVGAYFTFFVIYDFFYHLFHRFLHLRAVYPYVHKHHHRQCAPTRGNLDACNTHPLEYVPGDYLHLAVLALLPVHIYTIVTIVASMGIFASLNHTRYDVKLTPPIIGSMFNYAVAAHDRHHHYITVNYCQYTMLWDKLLGTFNAGVAKKDD